MSTTGTGAGLDAGQHSLPAFYRPFLPLFGTIFFCLLSVGASLATLPFWVTDRLGGGNLAVGFVVATIAVGRDRGPADRRPAGRPARLQADAHRRDVGLRGRPAPSTSARCT